ncbi:MAG: cohesin domain-containing protein [Patescibacteria group bacterium]
MRKTVYLFIISSLLCSFHFTFADTTGASLYLSPNSGTFYVGNTFNVSIFLDTGGNDVNAVHANLKFDPQKLQIASPTAGKSFISVWISQPTYSNKEGTASFLGGNPSPGINTSAGLVSTITFRTIAPGETEILFVDSHVLLDDGKGTDVLSSSGKGSYKITIPPPEGPEIFSPTHSNQNKWYKNNNPTYSWTKEDGISDFSFILDHDPHGVPDSISEGDFNSVSYAQLDDGIWYFHVKAKKSGVWGGSSHYLVQIDSTPPASFKINVDPSVKTANTQSIASFITTDALSGFDHFDARLIDVTPGKESQETGFFIETVSPYKLPNLAVGNYLLAVSAFDSAGNWRDESIKIEIIPAGIGLNGKGIFILGIFLTWWILALIFVLIAILTGIFLIYRLKKQQKIQKEIKERLLDRERKLKEETEKINKTTVG